MKRTKFSKSVVSLCLSLIAVGSVTWPAAEAAGAAPKRAQVVCLNGQGLLKVRARCRASETRMNVSEFAGVMATSGVTGPKGDPGMVNFRMESFSHSLTASGNGTSGMTQTCSGSSVVISGGCTISGAEGNKFVLRSSYREPVNPKAWICRWGNSSAGSATADATIQLMCADLTGQ